MADLRISELAALAGANLAAGDLLPIADISASETKKITVTDLVGNATTLIADATIPGAKILFSSNTVAGSVLQNSSVTATQLANDAVTAAKLADESSVDLVTTLPGSGAFVGQIALDTDDSKIYCWNGSTWVSVKAAGSVNSVVGSSSGVVNISVSTVGDEVTISTTLDNTSAAAQFLAGPTSAAGSVGYRVIAGADLPTATTSAKGGVIVNGNGLTMSGSTIVVDNTVTASGANYHIVQYNANGLVTAGRSIIAADVPLATSSTIGVVKPGSGLGVDGSGFLNHNNSVTGATATKVTFDTEGHITSTSSLIDTDIPNISADKITSGTFPTARIGAKAVTGAKVADYAVALFGETQPTAEHIGQFFFNPLTRDLYLWDGNVYQPVGISAGEIILAGTYDASTNLLDSVTAEGSAAGFTSGQSLPAAAAANNRHYVVVSQTGTGTSPAPTVTLEPPDILLSNGSSYVLIETSETITAQVASNVGFTPYGNISSTNVQGAIAELDDEKLPKAGGTVTGQVLIGTAGSLVFEGTTDNAFETTIAVTDPTADRTITLPDSTGTVVLSGAIVNADINASAAIADTKLATISTAGKVSGTAITSGNLSTSGSIATTSTVAVGLSSATANTDLDLAGTFAQTVVTVGALDIDCSTGNYFTKTINGTSTFTVSNIPSSRAYSFTLELTHTSGAITWFSGVEWPNGTAPTLTTGKTHLFMFVTDDGGTRWRASSLINYTN